ncbi:MAG: hypothetical protein RI967_108 [Planctomycetota bacterium]
MEDFSPIFDPIRYWPVLAGFLAGIAALLAVDLLVIERLGARLGRGSDEGIGQPPHSRGRAGAARTKVSAIWAAICVAAALGVAFLLRTFAGDALAADPTLLEGTRYAMLAPEKAANTLFLEFLTGYVVELSLSVDNLFVFLVIFRYFGLDHDKQHRVLFWGVVGAVVFRAIFIGVGVALAQYHWVLFAMGLFLIVTGVKLVSGDEKEPEPGKNPFIRMLSRLVPISRDFDGTRFFTRIAAEGGAMRLAATPLFVALIVVETTDLAFAVDSVPAVLAISQEPFVAFGSNICAILGLRAMFFVVAEAMQRFHLLKFGLGLVLVWVGLKMTLLPYLFEDGKTPIPLSLGVIVALIGGSMALSLILKPRDGAAGAPHA